MSETENLTASNDEVENLRQKLELLRQIQALNAETNTPHGTKPAMHVRVPEGSYDMSPTEYRTYMKDCKSYLTLTQLSGHDVVLQIRMNMDSGLKRIIDTNYPQWEQNTVDEALKIVGSIVHEVSNPAVYRHKFNQMIQCKGETVREFITKLRICSLDCNSVCPYDDQHNLIDYHLINRIHTGVYDSTLQREILQKHATLNTVETLLSYCENFESTKRDGDFLKCRDYGAHISSINTETYLDEAEVLAAISTYKKTKKYAAVDRSLGSCQHPVNRCPAFGKSCLKCGKKGHFYKMCLGGGGNSSKKLTSSALFISPIIHTCSKQKDSLPRLMVSCRGELCSMPT